MNQRGMKIATLIVLFIILAAIAIFFYVKHSTAPTPAKVQIDTLGQATIGNPNAKVHIVAFEDLKCVNCMRYETTVFPQIRKKYINTGIAKYTAILLAFIPGSPAAANAAYCAYAQKPEYFFSYVDYIFSHQPPENEDWATIPTLLEFASHIPGIDQNQLSQCLVENTYNDRIAHNFKLATKIMPQISTPSIYINGVPVQSINMKEIDRLIEKAKKE